MNTKLLFFATKVYEFGNFWTDALKDENSAEWYWETSGNKIAQNEFHWAAEQPNLEDPSIRSCIHFNCKSGYDDQICVNYLHDVFCQ